MELCDSRMGYPLVVLWLTGLPAWCRAGAAGWIRPLTNRSANPSSGSPAS